MLLLRVGAPKCANLYQVLRAATYVALGDYDPLKNRERIVIPAQLSERVGKGVGEQRFHSWLDGAADPKSLYESMRKGYQPGAQRAFVPARVLQKYEVWITNSLHPELAKDCLLYTSDNSEDAVEPSSDILIVPDAINTLLQSG